MILCVVLGGCDGYAPSQPSGLQEGPQALESVPPRVTTSELIAQTNLDAGIDEARRKLSRRTDVSVATSLVEQLLLRADFYGTYDDWDEALQVTQNVLDLHPDDPAALLLRARVLNTVHDFDGARDLIDAARASQAEQRASEIEVQALHLEVTMLLAEAGPTNELVALRGAIAKSAPSFQHETALALALAQQGRFGEADEVFRHALSEYRDVSPFPFAWVAFQRGVMWSEQADRPDLGWALYEEALHYLPGYVLANVHLAELEAQAGDVQSSIARVEPLVGRTQDPEPLVLLAAVESSPGRARRYAARAERAYAALVDRFPNAFLHHLP